MSETHLSDDQLVAALDGELAAADLAHVHEHLAACWTCRTRHGELATVVADFVHARETVLFAQIPPPPSWPRLEPQLTQLDTRQPRTSMVWTRAFSFLRLRAFFVPRWGTTTAGAAVVTIGIVAALTFYDRPLAASELLARARPVESIDGRRQLTIEERDRTSGHLRGRQRVDVWHNAARGVTARRLFDAQGGLLAGEWIRADGSRMVLVRGEAPTIEPAGSVVPVTRANAWRLAPAAKTFSAITSTPSPAQPLELAEYVDTYVVSAPVRNASDATIALTVRKADFYPVSHTLTLGATVVSVVEMAFDETPASSMPASVFEPDRELLGSHTAEAIVPRKRLPTRVARLHDADAAAVTLDALLQLDRAGALLGEQIVVTRSFDGVNIAARVDTTERRDELRAALAPVAKHPGLGVDVRTFADATAPSTGDSPIRVKTLELTGTQGPLYDELRTYFLAGADRGDTAATDVDTRIWSFTREVLDRARRAREHARAVTQLTRHTPEATLMTLDSQRQQAWQTAVAAHLQIVEDETRALHADLEPLFHAAAPEEVEGTGTSRTLGVWDDAARLLEMAASNGNEVGRAFSRSLDTSTAPLAVRSTAFFGTLRATERLASTLRTTMSRTR